MSRLENWSQIGESLVGLVFDDPRFSDGDIIRTSKLTSLDLEKSEARTQNTLYKLGKPYDGTTDIAEHKNGTVCIKNESTKENSNE